MTGTILQSDKPIFVLSGTASTTIELGVATGGAADTILETLPSIDDLGKLFVVVPYAQRTAGDIVRLVGKIVY